MKKQKGTLKPKRIHGTEIQPLDEYVGILRCRTWNVWPARWVAEERSLTVEYDADAPLCARLAILAYEPRSVPEHFGKEVTKLGPLLWDGGTPSGLYQIRNAVLKAPQDIVDVTLQYRNAHRGEIDICINFKYAGEITPTLVESLRATSHAVMSLINLRHQDFLTPSLPFQIQKVLRSRGAEMTTPILVAVQNRRSLSQDDLATTLALVTNALARSAFGPKLVVALELYAAHFGQLQTRVRFLLLVVAIESLSMETEKHTAALALLRRWEAELLTEMNNHDREGEAWHSLEALRRELDFRATDSIRTRIRKLFARIPGLTVTESKNLQRRALHVYDKRSILVHRGHLPATELDHLEREARELLEKVLNVAVDLGVRHSEEPVD